MNPAAVVVHGAGRMAAAIAAAAADREDVTVTALVAPGQPEWKSGLPCFQSLDELETTPDFLIDFTLPEGTLTAAKWCAKGGVPMVSGVTGLPEAVVDALETASESVPVLWSPNLSIGVNLLADLAGRAGAVLDDGVAVAIEDIHHQWKKDAPSGTALMLGERVAEGRSLGDSGISYSSVREGEVIGEHTVRFSLQGEEFELVHRALDRSIYARGAIAAGQWLMKQPPGLYQARDWLEGSCR